MKKIPNIVTAALLAGSASLMAIQDAEAFWGGSRDNDRWGGGRWYDDGYGYGGPWGGPGYGGWGGPGWGGWGGPGWGGYPGGYYGGYGAAVAPAAPAAPSYSAPSTPPSP
jgi:hypothetical protein